MMKCELQSGHAIEYKRKMENHRELAEKYLELEKHLDDLYYKLFHAFLSEAEERHVDKEIDERIAQIEEVLEVDELPVVNRIHAFGKPTEISGNFINEP